MAAGARIDDSGKVLGKIVGVAVEIKNGKSKRNFQRNLGLTYDFSVAPKLAINRDFPARFNRFL